jgi:hypothetical protein
VDIAGSPDNAPASGSWVVSLAIAETNPTVEILRLQALAPKPGWSKNPKTPV